MIASFTSLRLRVANSNLTLLQAATAAPRKAETRGKARAKGKSSSS